MRLPCFFLTLILLLPRPILSLWATFVCPCNSKRTRSIERVLLASHPIEDYDAPFPDNEGSDEFLEYAIDSFLRGDYAYQFASDAPLPSPTLTAGETVDVALRALRKLDEPEPAHGAAVMLRFCIPLTRAEKWDDRLNEPWKEVLRGSLTPEMFAKRIRSSPFAGLLDWTKLDVTEGTTTTGSSELLDDTSVMVGTPRLAFVNAALYFGNGMEPTLFQFTLRRMNGGIWMIDTARQSQKELFVSTSDTWATRKTVEPFSIACGETPHQKLHTMPEVQHDSVQKCSTNHGQQIVLLRWIVGLSVCRLIWIVWTMNFYHWRKITHANRK